jgi:hypothetical protein
MERHEKIALETPVWLFRTHERPSRWPVGVWSTRKAAEEWIERVGARGLLGAFVLDESCMESHVRLGWVPSDSELSRDPAEGRVFGNPIQSVQFQEQASTPVAKAENQDSYASVSFTRGELVMINNALNETCNGGHIEEFEFFARTGATRSEMNNLLNRITSLL